MPSVASFLDDIDAQYKLSGEEYKVRECPICGDSKGHFYIHCETGLWHCFKCEESGNLWTLRAELLNLDSAKSLDEHMKDFVDEEIIGDDEEVLVTEEVIEGYERTLSKDTEAIEYLLGTRKLTKATIKHFRLGLLIDDDEEAWLCIPYFKGGEPVNVKYRKLPPGEKKFYMEKGHERPLFNYDAINTKEPIFITEGELDAMSLHQYGYTNVVSVPLGAGNFGPEHFDPLVVCGRVNICFDMDEKGRKGMADLSRRLGAERCYDIRLPVKDANDFFKQFDRADFDPLVDDAQPIGEPVVLNMAQSFRQLAILWRAGEEAGDDSVPRLPWYNVNKIVGPLNAGRLCIVQAIPKTGKTTWILNALKAIAGNGHPAMIYCLEMPPTELLPRLISAVRNTPLDELTFSDITFSRSDLMGLPLYIAGAAGIGGLDQDFVFETIRYSVRRFGIKVLAFDNLHYLCRSLEHQVQEIGRIMRNFKIMIEELGIFGIMVVQPRKQDLNQVPGMYAARFSGDVAADCDLMISLYRKMLSSDRITEDDFMDSDEPVFEARTLVRVTASRYSGGGNAVLFFNDNNMTFEEYQE